MIKNILIAVAGNLSWLAERCFIGDDEKKARAVFGLGFILAGVGYWLLLVVVLLVLFALGFAAGCDWRSHFPL